jgi:hypothetical protein
MIHLSVILVLTSLLHSTTADNTCIDDSPQQPAEYKTDEIGSMDSFANLHLDSLQQTLIPISNWNKFQMVRRSLIQFLLSSHGPNLATTLRSPETRQTVNQTLVGLVESGRIAISTNHLEEDLQLDQVEGITEESAADLALWGRITVATYYRQRYGRNLTHADLPCLAVRGGHIRATDHRVHRDYFPLEVLQVDGDWQVLRQGCRADPVGGSHDEGGRRVASGDPERIKSAMTLAKEGLGLAVRGVFLVICLATLGMLEMAAAGLRGWLQDDNQQAPSEGPVPRPTRPEGPRRRSSQPGDRWAVRPAGPVRRVPRGRLNPPRQPPGRGIGNSLGFGSRRPVARFGGTTRTNRLAPSWPHP